MPEPLEPELFDPEPLEPELLGLVVVPVDAALPEDEELELAAFATAAPPPTRAPHTASATRLCRICCRIFRSPPFRIPLW